jgi:hypothetical protein
MTNEHKTYSVLPFLPERRMTMAAGQMSRERNLIYGMLEFDVTLPRTFIRDHKAQTGETLSFTAFLVGCLAQALRAHPLMQSRRDWHNQLISYHDVDVVTLIEPEPSAVAFPHVIRAAHSKSFRELHTEITTVRTQPTKSEQHSGWFARWGRLMPGFVQALFYRALRLNPHWLKKVAGTVVVTSVGMFVKGGGWGIGFNPFHTLSVTIGGITEKLILVQGQVIAHEFLCITLSIDHDVVDGAPAARFAQYFKELVETGHGLSVDELSTTQPVLMV